MMASKEQLALLEQGAIVWNKWVGEQRAAFNDPLETDAVIDGGGFRPDLSQAELREWKLSDFDLSGADLVEANLSGARLYRTNLGRALLNEANLNGALLDDANLGGAHLTGANLRGATLHGANLSNATLVAANLSDANLRMANLSGANLRMANLSGANLTEANLSEAHVVLVQWDRACMHNKYGGVRGIDSCFGNPLFKRAAADQDFLDTLENHWRGTWRMSLFRAWGWLDYGRSMSRVAAFASGIAIFYGIIFSIWHSVLNYSDSADTWFTPIYFSIVTFTTLGFGDVKPRNVVGELLASSEVIIGYITLGLLLAVLAEKLARRS